MRFTPVLLLCLTHSPGASGQIPDGTPWERVEVVKVDSTAKAEEIYRAARRWFVDAFRDADEAIQMDDPAGKIIAGKGWFPYNAYGRLWFTIEVEARDGRYRTRVSGVEHRGFGTITFMDATTPALSLGPIAMGDRCFTPLEGPFSNPRKEERDMLQICAEQIHPIMNREVSDLFSSLRLAVENGLKNRTGQGW